MNRVDAIGKRGMPIVPNILVTGGLVTGGLVTGGNASSLDGLAAVLMKYRSAGK